MCAVSQLTSILKRLPNFQIRCCKVVIHEGAPFLKLLCLVWLRFSEMHLMPHKPGRICCQRHGRSLSLFSSKAINLRSACFRGFGGCRICKGGAMPKNCFSHRWKSGFQSNQPRHLLLALKVGFIRIKTYWQVFFCVRLPYFYWVAMGDGLFWSYIALGLEGCNHRSVSNTTD